ncbi:hypothetical protein P3H15_32560 [Rhodococcus sp. T2V]|uniref:hypothetical protein n=1 Tax=Rhodococcus sp. T2V TaxID=3034164 RepID=UPI0023E10DA8|nr:hypothetical protein [Rhodococcus sp. T2V]MDF3309752.1 hypothetical protein [Rhodococcus sp. T2V]
MRTINKADWTPTPLVSPKGRLYTPSSYIEHKQLVASGYAPAPQPAPAEAAPVEPTQAAAPGAPPVPEAPAESSEKPTDDEPADAPSEAPKTKTTRRTTGGAQ